MKRHLLRDGRAVDVSALSEPEQLYLRWLSVRIGAGEPYEAVAPAVIGPGAYPLFASAPLSEVAFDLLARMRDAPAARRAGEMASTGILTVTEAARRLGISRVAVIKAIREQRLPAFRFD
ncbi:MAG TPA: helix-turn-helix domain-containing protein [Polyangia bacterium]|nr:helix-turn-helix domain-containing protein [Polyangia bacterium]